MKFLIDAQLPRRFVVWLTEAGHDALHTLDLPLKNQTPDHEPVGCNKRSALHRMRGFMRRNARWLLRPTAANSRSIAQYRRAGSTRRIQMSGGARPTDYFPIEGEME
jgi:hypothetical protein